MARATAEDKYVFVAGIKQKGGLIAMTGDSIADADALIKADVGLCMGSGCDVAKENSDLIIDDNNFESIHKAIKWGRALFDNVRKFIQFQLTMNLSLCFVTILGGLTLGRPPLNIVQMLWCNLIMDVLGAIAIATEPYNNSSTLARVSRDRKKNPLMQLPMWRQIFFMSMYQVIVMIILMYFGGLIFFDGGVNLISSKLRGEDLKAKPRLILDTLIFHTFILMNIFNSINCRVVDPNEKNVFKTLLNNPLFWFITLIEVSAQCGMLFLGAMDGLGSILLGTTGLTAGM